MLIRGLPPTSRLRAALAGGQPQWSVTDHLLAAAVDTLVAANWQRGNQGAKTPSPRPKPLPRPAVLAAGRPADTDRETARQAAIARAHAHRDAVAGGRIT